MWNAKESNRSKDREIPARKGKAQLPGDLRGRQRGGTDWVGRTPSRFRAPRWEEAEGVRKGRFSIYRSKGRLSHVRPPRFAGRGPSYHVTTSDGESTIALLVFPHSILSLKKFRIFFLLKNKPISITGPLPSPRRLQLRTQANPANCSSPQPWSLVSPWADWNSYPLPSLVTYAFAD